MSGSEKKDKSAEAFGKACGAVVVVLAFIPLRAWLFMLGVGAVHDVEPLVPTLGFGSALAVLLGWTALQGVKVSTK
ncbi:hypothetical protein ATKI12_6964 [Kitasatospora sp. Ki12]